jgi:hypothetical protein
LMESRLVMTNLANIGRGRQRRTLVITKNPHSGSLALAGSNLTECCRPNPGRRAYILEYELDVIAKAACRAGVVAPATILGGPPGTILGTGIGTVMHQGRITCSLGVRIQATSVHDNT